MRAILPLLLASAVVLSACISKKRAQDEARQAYAAGQAAAAKQWQAEKPPEVVLRGPVRNPVIAWTDDLTLAKAIVDADYTGFLTPRVIRVIRNGQMIAEMPGVDLLRHHDVPLQPGDIIDVIQ